MQRSTWLALLALLFVGLLAFSAVVVTAEDDDEEAPEAGDAHEHRRPADDQDLSSEQKAFEAVASKGTKHGFQSDVSRMMQIIINSLYTNKEIFLRELISNASDALDKARYLILTERDSITDPSIDYEIRIQPDPENRMLHITDTGVGMNREELVANLGTIAQSGTRNFLDKMKDGMDNNLIGQFGVGFYSAFLVADKVTVASVSATGKEQFLWQSQADDTFVVSVDPRGNTLKRGTRISLHLKDDCEEYLQEDKLRDLIRRYSEFINFPIYLYTSKEVEKEVEVEETEAPPKKVREEKPEPAEGEEEDDVEEEVAPTKKTKTITETVYEWQLVNENKPIWTRPPKDVDEDEYNKFFKNLTQETEPPLAYIHFKAEGDVEFRSILFVPGKAPRDLFENLSKEQTNIRLYVRRVFITDTFDDLMPRYLNFVTGVVDSDDLPLNVSREILQQSRLVRIIKKKLVRKVLEMLRKIAESNRTDGGSGEEGEEEEKSEDEKKEKDTDVAPTPEKYKKIWKEFGKNLRLGVVEDPSNRSRLAKLLRYPSTKTKDDDLIGFDGYVTRMKPGQKQIYYLAGEGLDKLKRSFLLEEFKARDLEVIYMTDPIDEYMVQHLTDYEDYKLTNIAKEGVTFDEGDDEKERLKETKNQFEEFTKWYKNLLGAKVDRVNISHRRSSQPALLLSGQYGVSANMMRILKAQALARDKDYDMYTGGKVLEINPTHPVIKSMKARHEKDPDDDELGQTAELLFETASIQTGFDLSDSEKYAAAVLDLLARSVGAEKGSVPVAHQVADEKKAAAKEEEEEAAPAAAEEAEAAESDGEGEGEAAESADSNASAEESDDEQAQHDEL